MIHICIYIHVYIYIYAHIYVYYVELTCSHAVRLQKPRGNSAPPSSFAQMENDIGGQAT